MSGLEKGAVCIKTKGRKAGARVVVVEFDKKTGFAIVEGKTVKRKRCNILHLFPTGEMADVKALLKTAKRAEGGAGSKKTAKRAEGGAGSKKTAKRAEGKSSSEKKMEKKSLGRKKGKRAKKVRRENE